MIAREYAVWLLARADQHAALHARVRQLAPRHEGHVFEPHVTLQADLPLSADPACALVDALAAATPVQRWTVGAVEGTGHYFRSLFLRLTAGDAFARLCRQCVEASGTEEGLSPYAHLSLAYGPTQGDAVALRRELTDVLGGTTLVLDRVALARAGTAVPIAQWQLVHVRPLVGAA
jgi:hypothetical protein